MAVCADDQSLASEDYGSFVATVKLRRPGGTKRVREIYSFFSAADSIGHGVRATLVLDNSPSFQFSIQGIQMLCRLITGFSFGSLCLVTALSTDAVFAADRGAELVQAVAQDSQSAIPEDNAATFHKSDPRVRLQLVRLDGSTGSLGGSSVTVINPQGKSTQLTADSKGLVSLSKVTAGLHAVVVSGAGGHAAVPLMLREEPAGDSAETVSTEDASVVSNDAVTTVHLPVMPIDPREVLRVATAFLPPAPAAGSVSGLDSPLDGDVAPAQAHLYHVLLGPDGRMDGRIISPPLPGAAPVNLAGINIMIYSGNQLVARAITDEQGRFLVQNLRPGAHGLIAAGQAGYAAFAFDADVANAGDVVRNTADAENSVTLVRMMQPGAAPLPVVIIPSPLVPSVFDAIREGQGAGAPGAEPLPPGVAPVPGAGFAGGAGGGGAFGGGGGGLGAAGGGLGGAGGLLALGGIGAAAAIAASNDNDRPIVLPPVATPAEPAAP